MHLFAYGTLMFPEVWDRVVGRSSPAEPATAAGFAVFRVRNGVYPVMVRGNAREVVRGVVYRDLDQVAFQLLDAYESDLYERIAIDVTLNSGETLDCQAYVLPESRASHTSAEHWDAEEFGRSDLAAYLNALD